MIAFPVKHQCIVFLISVFAGVLAYAQPQSKIFAIKTVAIDAGHGGHDYGCGGLNSKEKNIALDISLRLGAMIEKNMPDVRVVYTRKTDVFIELHERAGIANRAKADLFICIHCNSACTRDKKTKKEICNDEVYGPETFVMGLHKTEENLAVARRENESVLYEKDYEKRYDGYDPNSPEANIIFSLFQNAYMNQSIAFASKIQNEFTEYAGRSSRGVKQAGFLVLYRTAMPSVLVETGFLTSKSEEKYLSSDKGQTDVATVIFRAFKEYKIDLEGEWVNDDSDNQAPKQTIDTMTPPVKNNTNHQTKKDSLITEVKKTPVDSGKTVKTDSDSTPVIKAPVEPKEKANIESAVYYTVQIGAVPTAASQNTELFDKVENVKKINSGDGVTRFTTGTFHALNDALKKQNEMRTRGFKDAFVTAYHNNKRITLKEASELMNKK
ncbi:MAG: N-acetylmuramoyl-L-alanine amidase [Bacteroidia bacterium]